MSWSGPSWNINQAHLIITYYLHVCEMEIYLINLQKFVFQKHMCVVSISQETMSSKRRTSNPLGLGNCSQLSSSWAKRSLWSISFWFGQSNLCHRLRVASFRVFICSDEGKQFLRFTTSLHCLHVSSADKTLEICICQTWNVCERLHILWYISVHFSTSKCEPDKWRAQLFCVYAGLVHATPGL